MGDFQKKKEAPGKKHTIKKILAQIHCGDDVILRDGSSWELSTAILSLLPCWMPGGEASPSVSSPPCPADIGDGPGAGKCLSIIKNGCSVMMQEETSKTCDGFGSSVPGFAVVCGRTGCHTPAVAVLTSVSFCSEKTLISSKIFEF